MPVKYFDSGFAAGSSDLANRTLGQIEREFGARVEPFTLHLPVPELLAGAWMACRESLLAGAVRRELKEAVATTVSAINRCPYCVDAHTVMMLSLSRNDHAAAIAAGTYDAITDPSVRNAAVWASATLSPGSGELRSPPFSPDEAPEFIGTAVFFHYINRMVTVLLGASPLPFTKGPLKAIAQRAASLFFGRTTGMSKRPCASLDLLPEARLPDDLGWSAGSPCVATAYAAFSHAVDEAGEKVLSGTVRASVSRAVDAWDGSDPGTGGDWIAEGLDGCSGLERAAGELALLAALAPYRVTGDTVHAFLNNRPDNAALLAVLAWGSFTAARRAGRWIGGTESDRDR